MRRPLLSICIPTYNRAQFLEPALQSLVSQKAFLETENIEIVISDNASTDQTRQLCEDYAQKFPSKFHYHRNETNIGGDLNFEKVISLSRGHYAELYNDYLYAADGSLGEMSAFVAENLTEKPVLFFLQGRLNKKESKHLCSDLDEFLAYASSRITWIGGFGVWREDFDAMPDFSRYAKTLLVQADVLLRETASGKKAWVYSKEYFKNLDTYRKDKVSWNFLQVSSYNYLSLLLPYVQGGQLSRKTYQAEKKKLLRLLITAYTQKRIDVKEKCEISKYVMPFYRGDWFFYAMMPYALFSLVRNRIMESSFISRPTVKLKVKIYGYLSEKYPHKASYQKKYLKYKNRL